MEKKKKIVISSLIVCFFAGTFMMLWAADWEKPESERCDGGHTCAMKYADRLVEMKENKDSE